MLNVTGQAADLIKELVADADLPEEAGLRLAQRDDHTALGMSLAAEAASDDVVLVENNAMVFVGPMAAERVSGQTLDAEVRAGEPGLLLARLIQGGTARAAP